MIRIGVVTAVLMTCWFVLAVAEKREYAACGDISVKQKALKKRCNINVCFALDGSLSIPPKLYQEQKQVTRNVVRGISGDGSNIGLAAVQYAIINQDISPFTTNKAQFLSDLKASVQTKENGRFTVAGLNYCFSELFNRTGSNKIVLFGSGESTIGSDPGERADLFFQTGGKVCAVGVGPSQNITALTEIAGGDPNLVFSIKGSTSINEVSKELAKTLC